MPHIVFDPRKSEFKSPFGAVEAGSSVTLRVRALRTWGVLRAFFCFEHEQLCQHSELPMEWSERLGDSDEYVLHFPVPASPGLIWYHFRFETENDCFCWSRAGLGKNHDNYQLTVYINRSSTPEWFSEGVVYQIFPDRFFRTRTPAASELGKPGSIHENWSDIPDWRPDCHGRITNSDFFGGSLRGIEEKLGYLAAMGVSVVYINPIFKAASNHRYDTGDYMCIDPLLGTEEDFRSLCRAASEKGIRIILDGVFSHTGDDSRYFNKYGRYDSVGAYQSTASPYAGWYCFCDFPNDYISWWGIDTLPEVNELDSGYLHFIAESEDSVVRRWLRTGASGWRLDVADELPDNFIAAVRAAADDEKSDAFILGEVWEDATNKVSYGVRRHYIWEGFLDGVMNYPFRTAVMDYLLGGDASAFMESMETLRENYPRNAFYSCMNFLSTHDTPRILTLLGASKTPDTRQERAEYRLSPAEYELGKKRLLAAAAIMFTFPGAPTVFYGDEAGMQGFEDPFNRGAYPWGGEDESIRAEFSRLARLRRANPALSQGDIEYLAASGPVLAFAREMDGKRFVTMANAGSREEKVTIGGAVRVLPPVSAVILEE